MSRQSHIRLLIAAAAIASLAWFGQSSRGVEPAGIQIAQREAVKSPGQESASVSVDHSRYVGVAGCAAANCHGGDGSRGVVGSEYSIWIQDDPHAKAYTDLFNETSQRMAKALRLDKPAHEAKLCLNCHGPQSDPPFDGPVAGHGALLDGVSCESCHGAASRWLGPHVRRDWKQKSAAEKAAFGFRDTKDLWTRGKVCADCHVGEAGRDVNHDLYAAGHPRLFFELSAFNANLPAHWDRKAERRREAERVDSSLSPFGDPPPTESQFESKLWAVGQVASMEAALDLLIHRAWNATDDVPAFVRGGEYPSEETIAVWPELAETGCFACHHDLKSPSWQQKRGFSGRKPGSSPWQSWLTPLLSLVDDYPSGADVALRELSREMAKPYPHRVRSVEFATKARSELEKLGQRISGAPPKTRFIAIGFLKGIAEFGLNHGTESWDSATQVYLGLVALKLGMQDGSEKFTAVSDEEMREFDRVLEQIRRQLEFPDGSDSPRSLDDQAIQGLQSDFEQVHKIVNGIIVGQHRGPGRVVIPDR